MVGFALFNKELLSWYLITLKLKETIDSGIPSSSRLISSPSKNIQRPSEQLQIKINGDSDTLKEGPRSPESEWIVTARKKLKLAQKYIGAGTWRSRCIYKVPRYLQVGEEDEAYIPNTLSIGPYHHGKQHLQNMGIHKWRAFYQILKRSNQDAKLYFDTVKKLEQRARRCYEGNITVGSNEFVEMMVLDGCFVLEILYGAFQGFTELGYSPRDPIFAMRGSMHSIQRDMIMLENQIPLFILDTLLSLQFGYTNQSDQLDPTEGLVAKLAMKFFEPLMPTDKPLTTSQWEKMESLLFNPRSDPTHLQFHPTEGLVAKLAMKFFEPLMPTDKPLTTSQWKKMESLLFNQRSDPTHLQFDPLFDQTYLHCLHVFRQSLLGRKPQRKKWINRWSDKRTQLIHCVTELKEAGITFKIRRNTDQFWDIKFENGILMIPRLFIHYGTKSVFLNLIAFEQSHLDSGNEITSYVIFMDSLINSQEDVKYLHYCGIIEHSLGSDLDVATMFNRLGQEVVFDISNSYLDKLSKDVIQFYRNRWNTWRASLMHNYFNTPWAVISVFAAVILLILTAGQTFYGIYGYYNPP